MSAAAPFAPESAIRVLNPCPQRSFAGPGPDTPSNWFQHYSVGINGLCSVYTPPVSYWCSEHTAGGGAFAFRTPIGMTPKSGALPHTPYKDVSEAQVFVWRPARWANWFVQLLLVRLALRLAQTRLLEQDV